MSFAYRRADGDDLGLRPGSVALAGGTDLLPLYKLGLVEPDHVVDLKTSDLPRHIEQRTDGWRIGALATLADIEDHAELRLALPAVAEAVDQAATRQLRHRATVGGNLLQQPRCRYFRDETTTCWFRGGDSCPAREGRNEHHAVFDTGRCVAVQPSDLASVLVALDAVVTIQGAAPREVPVEDLLAPPSDDRRRLHTRGAGDIIESITVPHARRRSCYRKAMDRAAWAFALAGIAAAIETGDDGTITRASVVASGVATVPWRLTGTEHALVGRALDRATIADASGRAGDGATPLEENGYKVSLLQGLTRAALESL